MRLLVEDAVGLAVDFGLLLAVIVPFSFCCEARALALAAWDLSGIGYFFSSGNPNWDFFSESRFFSVNSATVGTS